MTKKLVPFKLPDSGVGVIVVGVSRITTMLRLKRRSPKPEAPMVRVEIAGVERHERNEADPDYLRAVEQWDSMLAVETMESTINRLAMAQGLTDDDKRAVAALRSAYNGDFDGLSDEYVWLTEIAITSDDDFNLLLGKCYGQADPSQEGVNQASKEFRRKV